MLTEWRPVVGHEGLYEVSDHGHVRRQGTMCAMKTRLSTKGYPSIQLRKDGRRRRHSVHVLVAEAFLGPRPPGLIVNHKDTSKVNNQVSNLEWTTYLENSQHAAAHGLVGGRPMPGEENGRAKLTVEQVAEIRLLKGKLGARNIAKKFGVSRSAVQFIHQDKHWKQPETTCRVAG